MEILVYITSDKERIITGNPLCMYIADEEERKTILKDIARALKADTAQLSNGDYIVING